MNAATIAQAVWEYTGDRSLVSGTPAAPTNRAEQIAKATWEYATRTLTLLLFIRGSADPFNWDAETPSWEEFTAAVTRSWRYAQTKMEYPSP